METVAKPHPVFKMAFSRVYPMYVQKAEKKGRTKDEVDRVIYWLTGYDAEALEKQLQSNVNFEEFFRQAPAFNPKASLVKGVVCGVRVENVAHPLMQKIRILDKLVDELAKGKAMEKVLR